MSGTSIRRPVVVERRRRDALRCGRTLEPCDGAAFVLGLALHATERIADQVHGAIGFPAMAARRGGRWAR